MKISQNFLLDFAYQLTTATSIQHQSKHRRSSTEPAFRKHSPSEVLTVFLECLIRSVAIVSLEQTHKKNQSHKRQLRVLAFLRVSKDNLQVFLVLEKAEIIHDRGAENCLLNEIIKK
jgi:hypothetical protein